MSWINDVRRYYDEPHRHYHNWNHIRYCLDLLLPLSDKISLRDWLCLRYALVGHDRVYDTTRKDNEERSAVDTCLDLEARGERYDNLLEVERLILLTKHHDPDPSDEVGQIMCDIDCAILGSSPDEYDEYAQAVRNEYDWVEDKDWRHGRAKVLFGFLARPKIFRSPYFQHLEEPARANIERELESLR